jgi:thioredoxin 1
MEFTDENFEKEIQNSEKPVMVDFWAEWCGPCSVMGPILEKVADDYAGKIIFGKVNIDASPVCAQKYGISQIPTVILFKNGKQASSFIGARPEEFVKSWLEEALNNN